MATKTEEQIIQEMEANSAAWHTADAETKAQLEAANQALGAQLGASFDSNTGTWSGSDGGSLYSAASGTSVSNTTNSTGSASSGTGSTYSPSYTGSANAVTVNTDLQAAYVEEMNANSIAWHTASDEEKAELEARNQYLADLLGGSVAFDSDTGYWSGTAEGSSSSSTFDLSTWLSENAKPTYTSSYSDQIDALLNEILTREDFSYSAEDDELYQQYAEMYNREGTRAMNDTLASVASSAGGMNSYAVTAAQQANDYYSSQLTDKIPELYQLAYEMYLQDKASQVEDLGLLTSMDDTQYSRYRDTMSDWYNDLSFAYSAYRDDVSDSQWQQSYDYAVSRDEVSDSQYEEEWNYSTSTNDQATAYSKAMALMASGVMPDADTLSAAGISETEASAYIAAVKAETASSGSGSGGSSTSYSDDVIAVASYLGVTEKQANALKTTGATQWGEALEALGLSGSSGSYTPGADVLSKIASLESMMGQTGSTEAIANSIVAYGSLGEISMDDAWYMLEYFGYDPSDYIEG